MAGKLRCFTAEAHKAWRLQEKLRGLRASAVTSVSGGPRCNLLRELSLGEPPEFDRDEMVALSRDNYDEYIARQIRGKAAGAGGQWALAEKSPASPVEDPPMREPMVKALVFDVFGTVVDWRTSVTREGESFGAKHGLSLDWAAFAEEWRTQGYHEAMRAVLRGEAPWMRIDAMHRKKLDAMLAERGITGIQEAAIADFNRVWHRLTPWPDSVAGLTRLKAKFTISTLSNGDFALLNNMAKNAGLPWDCIITSELAKSYKPDPQVYKLAARLLDLPLDQVMLCAAHQNDLFAAAKVGLRTGFITRPREWGPGGKQEAPPDPSFDVWGSDILDLAAKLGA